MPSVALSVCQLVCLCICLSLCLYANRSVCVSVCCFIFPGDFLDYWEVVSRPHGGSSTRTGYGQRNWDLVNVIKLAPITIDIGGLPKGTLITFSVRAHGPAGLGMPAFVNATTGGERIWSVIKLTQLPATLRGV